MADKPVAAVEDVGPLALHPTSGDPKSVVLAVVQRAPQWVRHDLLSKDILTRLRAEESLAAMVAGALEGSGTAAQD